MHLLLTVGVEAGHEVTLFAIVDQTVKLGVEVGGVAHLGAIHEKVVMMKQVDGAVGVGQAFDFDAADLISLGVVPRIAAGPREGLLGRVDRLLRVKLGGRLFGGCQVRPEPPIMAA